MLSNFYILLSLLGRSAKTLSLSLSFSPLILILRTFFPTTIYFLGIDLMNLLQVWNSSVIPYGLQNKVQISMQEDFFTAWFCPLTLSCYTYEPLIPRIHLRESLGAVGLLSSQSNMTQKLLVFWQRLSNCIEPSFFPSYRTRTIYGSRHSKREMFSQSFYKAIILL